MTPCRFNLLDERWIPVITKAGQPGKLGINEVFRNAGNLRCIRGESPVVTAALYRLLLAFLHRSLDGPADEKAWSELWSDGPSSVLGQLEKHGKEHREAFWLLGGERPFFQCPGLSEVRRPASQLLLYRAKGNTPTLFDHTVDSDHPVLPADVAARWLVAVQFYDTGGTKTARTGKLGSSPGHGNDFGMVLLEGATLWETLILNAVVYAPGRQRPLGMGGPHDCAVWERTHPPAPEPVKNVRPNGWAHLLTLPTRNVFLHGIEQDGASHVDGVVISPGEQLAKNLNSEVMAAFTARDDKKGADPVKLEMLRGVWRHATDLLLRTGNKDGRSRPVSLSEVAKHVTYGRLDPSKEVTLRVFGQKLMTKPGAVEYWSEEAFPIKLALLVAQERGWSLDLLFGQSVKLADDVGSALQAALRTYRSDLGATFDRHKHWSFLAERYWPHLDTRFQRLLHDVGDLVERCGPDEPRGRSDLRELFKGWRTHVCITVNKALDTWLDNSPGGSPRQVFELVGAEMSARSEVNKAFDTYDREIDQHIV